MLEPIVGIARERGLALENPLEFHRALPRLAAPGEGFAVMRGEDMRYVCSIERPIDDMGPVKSLYADAGGPVGCDAVVLPAPGRPDTENEVGGLPDGDCRYAINDGLLAVWTLRESRQATGEHFDTLERAARALLG